MRGVHNFILCFLLSVAVMAQEQIVRLDKPYSRPQAIAILEEAGYGFLREISFPPSSSFPEGLQFFVVAPQVRAVHTMRVDSSVLFVIPDQEIKALATPLDPGYEIQKQDFALISAPEAWDLRCCAEDVIVAILDTGVDLWHQDLAANIWTNPGEFPHDGIDNDQNGYIDDIHGWNFVDNNNVVYQSTDEPHGTHVAGIIGAVGNNSLGVTGTAWQVQLMVLKILGPKGTGFLSHALEAFAYAAKAGAKIANNSWGHDGFSEAEMLAIAASELLFICAAGNEGTNNDLGGGNYPSSYDLENIIAVAATNENDELAWFSNYGASSVQLAAPGVSIYSTYPGDNYGSMSGTSMATPFVAGAAALLMARYPQLPSFQAQGPSIRSLLLESADPLASSEKNVAYGRLNMARALGGEFMIANSPFLSPRGGEVFKDAITVSWQVPQSTREISLSYKKSGGSWQPLATSLPSPYLWETTHIPGGKYQLQLAVTGALGETGYFVSGPFTIIKNQGRIQPLPNPATDRTSFYYQLAEGGELFIFNLKGKLIYKESLPPGEGSWLWALCDQNGQKLAGGVYYYHLKERGGSINGKLIIQR